MQVYVRTQGARIVKEGRHLLVRKGDGIYQTLFVYKLRQLLIFGNIDITHSARTLLMRGGIDTVFLTRNGRYLGRLTPEEAKNVFLRKRQFLLTEDSSFCRSTAVSIVAGKMKNMSVFLLRIRRARKVKIVGQYARQIRHLLPKLDQTDSIDSLRGYEGRASALFFKGFPHGFVLPQGFHRRVRRPPTDPVNAVLSLLYTLLMNRVYAAVRTTGLDPYPGCLHSLDYGRYSLVLDLMEEFRTPVVDTLTLSLFNLNILKPADFRKEQDHQVKQTAAGDVSLPDVCADPMGKMALSSQDAEGFDMPVQRMADTPAQEVPPMGKPPVRLCEEAFRRVIDAFERKLTQCFHHPLADRQMTYAEAIRFQVGQYRKLVEGDLKTYQPFQLK